MKRALLLLPLFCYGTVATASSVVGNMSDVPAVQETAKKEKGWSGMVGLAGASVPEYSGAEDSEGAAIPLIVADYNDTFYFKINRLGAWFLKPGNGDFKLGAVIKPRKGYEEDDADALDGMSDREDSTEAGLNFEWNIGKAQINGMFLTDVSDETEGDAMSLNFRYAFIKNKQFQLLGQVGFESLSEEIVSYYYGVTPSEATTDRGVYAGDDEIVTNVAVVGMYSLNPKWLIVGGLVNQQFGDEIKDSPIVEEDSNTIALAGATYLF